MINDEGMWTGSKEELKELLGREPCCRYDLGGSHYHCSNCGGVSSSQGHYGRPSSEQDWGFYCPKVPRIAPLETGEENG